MDIYEHVGVILKGLKTHNNTVFHINIPSYYNAQTVLSTPHVTYQVLCQPNRLYYDVCLLLLITLCVVLGIRTNKHIKQNRINYPIEQCNYSKQML